MNTIDKTLEKAELVFADSPTANADARKRNEWRRAHLHVWVRLAREVDAKLGDAGIDANHFAVTLAKVLPLTEHGVYEIEELLRALEVKDPKHAQKPPETLARAAYLTAIQPALAAHKARYPERVGGPRERFVRSFYPGAASPTRPPS